MQRVRFEPRNLDDVPLLDNLPGRPGATRRILWRDEASGSTTFVQTMPPGYRPPNDSQRGDQRFEAHSCHEELFNLRGVFHFGDWYDLPSLGYLNHPPYWVHPVDQTTETGVTFLIKFSGELDFFFYDVPEAWDGREFVHPDAGEPSPSRGLSSVHVDSVPWGTVRNDDGTSMGFHAKHLWDDEAAGWVTWLARYPTGRRGQGPQREVAGGGDEWFVLAGSLRITGGLTVRQGDYLCDPERAVDGGASAASDDGCVAIRWTRGLDHLRLPPIPY